MLKKSLPKIITFIVILLFFLFTIKEITLPFYWDTGAFLIPAAKEMTQSRNFLHYMVGMTDYPHTFLLPMVLSIFFRISDNPIILIHLFSILVSTLFLIIIFFIANKKYNKHKYLAPFLLISFATNPLFIAQTDLVYFEIIGSLFRFAAIYFLSKKKYKYFTVMAITAFLIRFENGFILPFIGLFDYLIFSNRNKKLLSSNITIILTTITWFIIHRIFTGWWFYSPERYFAENHFLALKKSINYLLLWQGRYIYSFFALLIFIKSLFSKNLKRIFTIKYIKNNQFLALLLINTIPIFIIIAKLGYFLPRYIFPALLPFYLLVFFSLQSFKKKINKIFLVILFLLPIFQINNINNCFSYNYEDCVYVRNLLKTKKEAILYIENNYKEDLIYAYYEDNNSLTNTTLGFSKKMFKTTIEPTEKIKVIYITPTSHGDLYNYAVNNNFQLSKSFNNEEPSCLIPKFISIPCTKNKHQNILIFTK